LVPSTQGSRYLSMQWFYAAELNVIEEMVMNRWNAWDISSMIILCPSISSELLNHPKDAFPHLRAIMALMIESRICVPKHHPPRSSFSMTKIADEFVVSSSANMCFHWVPFALAFQTDWLV
jgi:hypothetical protein